MDLLYFIPPLVILGLIAWRNTVHAILITIAIIPAYLLRADLLGIPTTLLELSIYTIGFLSLVKHIRGHILESHWFYVLHKVRPYVMPVMLLFVALALSTMVSRAPMQALGIFKAWFVAPIIFGIVFLDAIDIHKQLTHLCVALTASTLPVIGFGLYEYLRGSGMTIHGRLDSFFPSPNFVAMYLVPIMVFAGALFVARIRDRTQKPLSPLCFYYGIPWIIGASVTLLLTQSFGGWLAFLGGTMFAILSHVRITPIKTALFALIFIILSFVGFLVFQKSISHFDSFWQVNSLQTRTEIWANSLKLLSEHPIRGIGLGNFQNAYESYVRALPEKNQPVEIVVLRPHNIFLAFWLETGLAGLAAFIWLIAIFYQKTIKERLKHKNTLIIAPSAAMAALLLHGLIDTPYFKNDLSLLFWILVFIHLSLTVGPYHNARRGQEVESC